MTKWTPGPWTGSRDGYEAEANAALIAAAPALASALAFALPYLDEWVDMFDPSDHAYPVSTHRS